MRYADVYPLRALPTITPWDLLSVGPFILHENSTLPASIVWPTANKAIYVPFTLNVAETALKLFCGNGAVVSGNVDVGVYTAAGARVISSGSTAQSGTSVLQVFDTADTLLVPGYYYFAMAVDNITAEVLNSNPATFALPTWGVKQEAAAFPLPATATFATMTSNYLPFMGISLVTSL